MALALTTGTGQVSTATSLSPVYPAAASYVYSKDEPGESVFKNVVGTLEQPNYIRHAYQQVADIFKNTGVDPAENQSRTGLSMLAQVVETWMVDDSANTSLSPIYFPASAHYVVKVPIHTLVTPAVVEAFMRRLFGAACRSTKLALVDAITPAIQGVTRL